MARFMGDGLSAKTIEWQFFARFKPVSKEQIRVDAAAGNPGAIEVEAFQYKASKAKGRFILIFSTFALLPSLSQFPSDD
jgi:hypothetical protein